MNSTIAILFLEDDPNDAGLVEECLQADHFTCRITRVQERAEFLAALEDGEFDLILSDHKLPAFDGLSALNLALSVRPDIPFIFVSGTLGEEAAIEALKVGATDYVLKTRMSRLVPAVRRALGEARDRMARQGAEDALRRREKELRDVIEAIPAIAFTAQPDGSSVWINRQWVEFTGLTLEETSGSGWQSAMHPDDLFEHAAKWHHSMATGEPFEHAARHRSAKGEYRWFLVRAVPLRDEHGKILKWYGTLTDIEDRKRVEGLLAGENRILEMVAKGDSLSAILDSLCQLVEEQADDVLASILLLDGDRLRHGGAPSLPQAYSEAIDGAVIGPSAGSCGTAAFTGKQVIVQDIATDPLWKDYRDLALPHSLS